MASTPVPDELITVKEVAALLKYDPNTIYRKARKGEIPGLRRFGGGIRFVKSVVIGWRERRHIDRDV